MKTVILCGGKGTRLGEVTQNMIPKPMANIGEMPIVEHIMRYYYAFGHKDFVLCVGHLSWAIKSYFLNMRERHGNITIDFATGGTIVHEAGPVPNWKVTICETGADTMTAGRIGRVLNHLDAEESFMLTYGDGVSNVDLSALLDFHKSHGRGMTMTGIIPPGRFGELVLDGDRVAEWAEKPQRTDRYINGGFMVMRRDFAETYVKCYGDDMMLEREPLERAAADGELMLYRHDGFWQCMDTLRDWELLNHLWSEGKAPWRVSLNQEKGGA
jgi:glucose-1-phosphate cytidylyltransferase